jgi:POLO box duplicated region
MMTITMHYAYFMSHIYCVCCLIKALLCRNRTIGASSGACALIPFGQSSISFSAAEASAMGCVPSLSSTAPEMPFLKKWVRTKHAILFRLSNRTVQVLFMDRRFVLVLSSIYYSVSRSSILDEVLQHLFKEIFVNSSTLFSLYITKKKQFIYPISLSKKS